MSKPVETGAFSARAALLLVAGGAALFMALLWMIGTGYGFDNFNDGGGHAGGKGLNGFAGLVQLAAADGWNTGLARDDTDLDQPGLLVLTPDPTASGPEIARIVNRHRQIGPVFVIAPKWVAERLPRQTPGAKDGWVALIGIHPPLWPKFLDRVTISTQRGAERTKPRWQAAGLAGRLSNATAIETGSGDDDSGQPLVPLAILASGATHSDDTMLAAYVADARPTLTLDRLAQGGKRATGTVPTSSKYPLVLVFEPDLLDNYGLADPANAALATRLLDATSSGGPRVITFDLTLDGLGRTPNLLTLAFTPPYVAATLCLILAALAAGWRSFCRFGSPRAHARELAFGKARLVENSAALILRARRLHLLAPPYVAGCRDRIARALALPRHVDLAQTDAAIDRALTARHRATAEPVRGFAETAQDLHQARGAVAIVAAARALHQLEKRLTR